MTAERRGSGDATAFPEVESLARGEEIVALPVVVLAVVDPDHAPPEHLEAVALDHDGGRLVDPEAEQLGVGGDHPDEVPLAVAGEQVLIDRHAPEIAEALLVARGHQDGVALPGAPDQVRPLDRRPGRGAADHAAP